MKYLTKLAKTTTAAALVLFGAMAAGATRTLAVEAYETCDGRSEDLCSTKEVNECVDRVWCGVLWFGNWPHPILCCQEYQIVEDYYYYRHAAD